MSDTGNLLGGTEGGGGTQAATLTATVNANVDPFIRNVGQLQQRSVGMLRAISTAFGTSSPFGPLLDTLTSLTYSFGQLDTKGQRAATTQQRIGTETDKTTGKLKEEQVAAQGAANKFDTLGSTSTKIFYLSTAVFALGASLTRLAAPLQIANATLTQAISNTSNAITGQANDISDYSSQIEKAVSTGQRYGYSQDQIKAALAQLTIASKDPARALRDLTVAEEAATRPGMNLATAVNQLSRTYGGFMRFFTQFGISLPRVETSERALEAATTGLAAAQDKLSKAQQRLSDFNSELADSMARNQEAWAARVQKAQQTASDAEQHYQEVLQKVTIEDEQQRIQLAQTAEDNAKRVMDAEQAMADLQIRLARQKRDALQSLQDVMLDIQMSPATTGEEQIRQQERLRDASQNVSDQQQDSARETKDAQDKINEALKEQTDTRKEQLALDAQELQDKMALEAATKAQATAQAGLAAAQQGYNDAGKMTLSQQHELRDLQAGVATATDGVTESQNKLNDAKNQQQKILDEIDKGEAEVSRREKGVLDARADTWAGFWARIKAQARNAFEDMGNAIGGPLTMIGGLGMAIGGLGQITSVVGGMFGGGAAAEGGAAEVLTFMAEGGAAATLGWVAAIAAAIAAVGIAVYYVVTHWKQVSKWFGDYVVNPIKRGWDDLWAGVKRTFHDLNAKNFPDLVKDMGNILSHVWDGIYAGWHEVQHFFGGIGAWLVDEASKIPGQIYDVGKDIIMGLWHGIHAMWNNVSSWLSDLWHNSLIGQAVDILRGHSPSKVFMGIGSDIMEGLAIGMEQSSGRPKSVLSGVLGNMTMGAFNIGGPGSDFGAAGYGLGSGGGYTHVYAPKVIVQGSVVTEKQLLQKMRDNTINAGRRNGGNYYGGEL